MTDDHTPFSGFSPKPLKLVCGYVTEGPGGHTCPFETDSLSALQHHAVMASITHRHRVHTMKQYVKYQGVMTVHTPLTDEEVDGGDASMFEPGQDPEGRDDGKIGAMVSSIPNFPSLTRCDAVHPTRGQCLIQSNDSQVLANHTHTYMPTDPSKIEALSIPELDDKLEQSKRELRDLIGPEEATPRGVGRYPKVRDLYQDTRDKLYRLLADTQPDSMTRSQVTMMNDLQSRMEALITLNKTEPTPSVSWLNSKDKS